MRWPGPRMAGLMSSDAAPSMPAKSLHFDGKVLMRLSYAASAFLLSLLVTAAAAQQPHAFTLHGDSPFTHDPPIGREGNMYYFFATAAAPGGGQFAIRCSSNLTDWKLCGHVFDQVPAWIQQVS